MKQTLSLSDSALGYARRGWGVFPVRSRGKDPLTATGFKEATTDIEQLTEWWKKWPNANIGIACGISKLLVLDVDGEEGRNSLADYPDIETITVKSAHGHHYYFQSDDKKYKNKAGIKPGLDIRTDGGYIVAPPSMHKEGVQYTFVKAEPLAPIPEWLLELLEAPPDPKEQVGDKIPIGQRNDTLFRFACRLRSLGMSEDDLHLRTKMENLIKCTQPLPDDEIKKIVLSAMNQPVAQTFHYTQMGNGQRMVAWYGENFRYNWSKKDNGWLVWNGNIWKPDATREIFLYAKAVVDRLYRDAADLVDKARDRMIAHAQLLERLNERAIMIKEASFQPGITLLDENLDQDKYILGVGNGYVNLESGELEEPDRKKLVTKIANVEYDEMADCPKWLTFLDEIMPDPEIRDYLQEICGYSMTGSNDEQCFFILHGLGANGKSTFLEVIKNILGDYASTLPAESFMLAYKPRSGSDASSDLASLPGVRFLISGETHRNRRLNEALIKALTGGDTISTRELYERQMSFEPQFKWFFATNHMPTIAGTDHAIWRRIHKIPFDVKIPPDAQNPLLKNELLEEAPGILNWMIEGCMRWMSESRLHPPSAVNKATDEYQDSQDILKSFLDSCTHGGEEVPKGALYDAYYAWSEENGAEPLKKNPFGSAMLERGYKEKRSGKNRLWRGIELNV